MASSLMYLLPELGWLKNSSTRTQPEGLHVVTPAWWPQDSQTSYMVAQVPRMRTLSGHLGPSFGGSIQSLVLYSFDPSKHNLPKFKGRVNIPTLQLVNGSSDQKSAVMF